MTDEASSVSPQMLISNRLRQAMVQDERFRHSDGAPNKRAFARALREASRQDGENDGDLGAWERKVYRWTSEENPGGMNDANAELVARVLGLDPGELKLHVILEGLLEKRQEADAALEQLADQVEQLALQVAALQQQLAGPEPAD